MLIKGGDFDDLSTSVTVCKHKARNYIVKIQLLTIFEFFLSNATELASWGPLRCIERFWLLDWGHIALTRAHLPLVNIWTPT